MKKMNVFLLSLICVAVAWAALGVVPVDDTSISSKLWGALYRIDGTQIDPGALYRTDGTQVNPGQVHTVQNLWTTLGSFQATATTPGVASRTSAAFNSDAVTNATITIDPSWNAIRVRVSSNTDNNQSDFDFFLMNGTDHFNRIASTVWTTGTQVSGTAGSEFADTLTVSNANWGKSSSLMSPAGEYIAEWWIDVAGSSVFGVSITGNDNGSGVNNEDTAIVEVTGF